MAKRYRLRKLLGSTKTKLLAAAVLLLIFGAGVWALGGPDEQASSTDDSSQDSDLSQVPTGTSPNLDPPTKQEKQETEDHKKTLSQPPPSPATPDGKKIVYPVIVSASPTEVRAYVSGVIEDGGICTFTFSKSGQTTASKTSEGIKDAQTTICTPISPPPQVTGSGWSVVVSYSSSSSGGKSEASMVN